MSHSWLGKSETKKLVGVGPMAGVFSNPSSWLLSGVWEQPIGEDWRELRIITSTLVLLQAVKQAIHIIQLLYKVVDTSSLYVENWPFWKVPSKVGSGFLNLVGYSYHLQTKRIFKWDLETFKAEGSRNALQSLSLFCGLPIQCISPRLMLCKSALCFAEIIRPGCCVSSCFLG